MTPLPPELDDAEILAARGPRAAPGSVGTTRCIVEPEALAGGGVADVAAVFVTGPECPFRCLMCDLWQHTRERGQGGPGVAEQVERALREHPDVSHVKLYNAGSFFDAQAVPDAERERIAELVGGRERVIVECHPQLVDRRCTEFAAAIAPVELEVAMGLETVDPLVLARLNKRMTLDDFDRAAGFLRNAGVALRAFVLLGPPGHVGAPAVDWAKRSVEHAHDVGASTTVVIPVRPGNGILDQLEREGHFARPTLAELAEVLSHALAARGEACVSADLWDVEAFFDCPDCSPQRAEVLRRMNLTQRPCETPACHCRKSPA